MGGIVTVGMSFGINARYAINPARDPGPRLCTAVAGWRGEVVAAASAWRWVPAVARCVVAPAGAATDDLLVTPQHPSAIGFGETAPPALATTPYAVAPTVASAEVA